MNLRLEVSMPGNYLMFVTLISSLGCKEIISNLKIDI